MRPQAGSAPGLRLLRLAEADVRQTWGISPAGLGCNIVQSDQFTNVEPAGASTYFQRIEFDFSRIHIGAGNTEVSLLWTKSPHTALQECRSYRGYLRSAATPSVSFRLPLLITVSHHQLGAVMRASQNTLP